MAWKRAKGSAMDQMWIVKGNHVGLRATQREDFLERWSRYGNDAEIMMRSQPGMPPVTRAFFEDQWSRVESGQLRLFDVLTVDEDRLVGEGLIVGASWPAASARIGMTVFDPEDRRKGYGTEGVRLIGAYAFDGLGLNRVQLEFLASNAGLERLCLSYGMKKVGTGRQAIWAFGAYQDLTILDALKDEIEPQPETAFLRDASTNTSAWA